MPPVGQMLTAAEKGLIRKWINDGAEGVSNATAMHEADDYSGTEHWSFHPPVRPAVPVVADQHRVRNSIDAFIIRSLAAKDLALAPEADRLTLLRRASFDLTGIPPSPADVERFLGDESPLAFERFIDELLGRPEYSERWARHWLDVTGYAESAGILSEDRVLPLAWKYRDYVIKAFNSDKPYDRFLREQIAGDELRRYWEAFESEDQLPSDVVEGIVATGYLRTAADPSRPDFSSIKNSASQYFYPTLFDTLQVVCSSTMGLTVQCARCHSHKFDPIPQADYYRLQSIFMGAYRPDQWIPQMNRRLPIATKREKETAAKINADIDARVKKFNEELAAVKTTFTTQLFMERANQLPTEIREDVKAAIETAKEKRNEVQKYLVDKFGKKLKPQAKELDAALAAYPDYKTAVDQHAAHVKAAEGQRRQFEEVRALYDVPGKVTTPVLLRGDPLTPGPLVEPGVISAFNAPIPFTWSPPAEGAKTSGRRLAFARWLTQPEHPLTARVMVNRIWMHHFGTGIVATLDDFGVSGSPPSHPELLDWLATEFVRSGWSMKHMHRLILTSSTWRQRSRVADKHRLAAERVDPENALLWRQSLRRLEAESLRDTLLATSDLLGKQMYGPSHAVARQKDGEVTVAANPQGERRSIYVKIQRLNPETMLQVFDQPTMSVNCTQRSTSTVSTQALTMLNSDLMTRVAQGFARRVLAEQPEDPIGHAALIAFSRRATAAERDTLARYYDELQTHYQEEAGAKNAADGSGADGQPTVNQSAAILATAREKALADLCQMLMSANEFVYVD